MHNLNLSCNVKKPYKVGIKVQKNIMINANITLNSTQLCKILDATISHSNFVLTLSESKFCIDTRKLQKGEIFVAIKGQRVDSHTFLKEAQEKGASAIMGDKNYTYPDDISIPIIKVRDTIHALQSLASYLLRRSNVTIIGITGSNGKTTTKDFLRKLLSHYAKVYANPGNFNSPIGLPLSVLNGDINADFLILEMGISNPNEMEILVNIARPKVTLITNIGSAHLGTIGSQKEIAQEKSQAMRYSDTAILNCSTNQYEILENEAKSFGCKIITFGKSNDATVKLIEYENSMVRIIVNSNEYSYRLPFYGNHFADNSIAAIAVLVALQLEINESALNSTFSDFSPIQGRGDTTKIRINGKEILLINDCYNAAYESISALTERLKYLNKNTLFIMGSIISLGEYADEIYTATAKKIAELYSIILVGSDKVQNIKKILQKETPIYKDCESLIQGFDDIDLTGIEIIAVKGSNFLGLEKFISFLKEKFSCITLD